MFCPEGYVTLYDTFNELSEVAWRWWEAKGKSEAGCDEINQTRPDVFKIDLGQFDESSASSYPIWGIAKLTWRHRQRLFVSSPTGQIMRLGGYAYDRSRFFDGPFPNSPKEQEVMLEHLSDGFFHFDYYSGIIAPCDDSEIIERYGLKSDLKYLAGFEGWAVCWKPDNFAKWPEEIIALLHEENELAARSRHTLAEERGAAREIIHLFDADDQVTRSDCKAKFPRLGTNAFERAWAMARAERPGLGKGGRPKTKPQT